MFVFLSPLASAAPPADLDGLAALALAREPAALAVARTAPPAWSACVGSPDDRVQGWGCREEVRGWQILDLHGTDRRIGELYGTLLREELLAEWVTMDEAMYRDDLPWAFRALFLRQQHRFSDYFDAAAQARAGGLEGVLGLAPGTVRKYAWLGDLGSVGPSLQLALGGAVQYDMPSARLSDRCTTVIATDGEATIHARNLDYWGMGYWQPNATLLFVEPLDAAGGPDGFRYAHLGTLGEMFAGSTGVNEHGLVVSTHLHVSRDVALVAGRLRVGAGRYAWEALAKRGALPGESMYVLVESVLRRARDVTEAAALLEAATPVGAWSFALSDPSGRRAVVGVDHRMSATTWGGTVNTNFYRDDGMHERESHPARGPVEGSFLRFERAASLLGDGRLDVAGAVAILRDRLDLATGTERPVSANSVLSPDTSQSVVIATRPDTAPVIWLHEPFADGYTPAALAPFFAVSFADGMRGPGRPILGTLPEDPGDRTVLLGYLDAMRLAIDAKDRPAAAARLRELGTTDPGIRLMSAWASAATGDLDLAASELARFDPDRASHHHRGLAWLLRGELAWRAGDEAAAIAAWQAGLVESATDAGPLATLDLLLRRVFDDRVANAGRRHHAEIPFPSLKFQDVVELRLGR